MELVTQHLESDRFLRLAEVRARTGLAVATIYKAMSAGRFPRQIRVGRAAVWSERELCSWQAAQIAARDAA